MRTISVIQGTPEWGAHRGKHHGSSEAPAMMGASTKVTRNELLRRKATGSEQEYSQWVLEVLFARGHEVEALVRPIAEKIIGDELFPSIGINDKHPQLAASFDGITMDESVVWEGKQWNVAKVADVRAGKVPEEDIWQCVHQLLVSGAERLLYTVSDGTEENTVSCWLSPNGNQFKALLDGWNQFDQDVAAYKPEPTRQEFIGRAPGTLPALHIDITGAVRASNLPEFKEHAIAVFQGINTELATDQDFADAERTVKWCKEVEDKLEAAKQHALSQTSSIDELFRTIDAISEEARAKRLELDKLVKSRKDTIRFEAVQSAESLLRAHCQRISDGLVRVRLPAIATNFPGVIKGLKTISSINNALDTELARAKIEASNVGEKIRHNLSNLDLLAGERASLLCPDLQAIVTKEPEDFLATVKMRIAEHTAQQQKAQEAEAARQQAAPPPVVSQPQIPRAASGTRIKLGDVNAAIAPLSITAEGLASIGFQSVGVERAAKLYNASDLPAICRALSQRLLAVANHSKAA